MFREIVACCLMLLPGLLFAQQTNDFKLLRYDEDYSFLYHDSAKNQYNKFKFIALGKDRRYFLTLGGEARYQYFRTRNEDWGETPEDHDGCIFSRLLFSGDIHLHRLRLFVETQSSGSAGQMNPTVTDENPLDLHQAFADLKLDGYPLKVVVRIGRQEMSFGSQRLFSVRELPNSRQAFDVAKIILYAPDFRSEIFFGNYVISQRGIFDDDVTRALRVWGVYSVKNNVPVLKNVDLYYLGIQKQFAVFDHAAGEETRHTLGTRVWRQGAKWRYDLEATVQFGTIAAQSIRAWSLSSNIGVYLRDIMLRPELGLKTELISGDRSHDDRCLQTFNPMFPKGAYFGLAALIGPSNLADIHPSVLFHPAKDLLWSIDYDVFWRYSRNDGIYAPNVSLIYSGDRSSSKFIGDQIATDIQYLANRFLSLKTSVTWFRAGVFLKEVGPGKDILLFSVTTQLKF